ncbi:WD repeat-containing protein 35 isoform X2 [Cimex lectularius]|uniref:WD repeat-containing protein 55 homolog n=1 Tax=Cimex lectularius TaxID=79782 RepID=A0A8I6RME9_CIMLE|nr:WD repeat-containing protein 35 isoform X2 [Cimex lectularius]
MYIYLSKKIAVSNSIKIYCLAWSSAQGWIAVGGDEGLLKVLKLDAASSKGVANPAVLAMNQTLGGHKGRVQVITWNEKHEKLTTSDQNGLIIVWTLYKGIWHEEMINNRNQSVVRGMAWDSEGQKICIVYEDGAVIVGSVDGNRIFGIELKGVPLSGVQWSPDGKLLVFCLKSGEVHVYDNQGNFTMKVHIQCFPSTLVMNGVPIVGMTWYDGRNGFVEKDCPCFAIVYQTGHIQIMRHQNDENPVIVDSRVNAVHCSWNHNGTLLAVVGSAILPEDNKESNVVQFISLYGEHVRTMKIPGRSITACQWEGTSLRLAFAVDSFVYFAILRPDYKWGYFSNTLVFSYPGQTGTNVTFWDTNSSEIHNKVVPALYGIAAYKEYCVLATKDTTNRQYGLLVCNAISTPVDRKYTDVEPLFIALNSTHVFAASKDHFLIWHFMTPKSHSTLGIAGNKQRKERLYHVDDTPSGVAEVIQDLDKSYQATGDPICCMAASDKVLVIGRESGALQRYSLPQVALVQRYGLSSKPQRLAINSNSTRLSIIDNTGIMTLVDPEGGGGDTGRFERRDVWDMLWASDNPDLIAIMEKTRMYVIRGNEPEEPINCSGYVCTFQDLVIRTILLDDIMAHQDALNPEEHIIDLEVKSLRDTRQLLEKVGIAEATSFIEENPHPRLWRLLAEAAVKKLDLKTAEAAFVRCSDYPGIQLIKRLSNVTNDQIKRAQVAAYFGDFNEAEKLYLDIDRRDLAIALRERLGDWFRVIQLMKLGTGGTDSQLQTAWNSIGDYFADRGNWENAKEYYEKARNTERLMMCCQHLEDYESLEKIVSTLPDKHSLLKEIGEIFVSVGMCSQAVATFVKAGMIQTAVQSCVSLNQWDQAVALAETYNMLPQIASLLDKYARSLTENNRHLEVIQLYRKANRYLDAAKIMFQLAEKESVKCFKPVRIKRLYVLAALLVEEYTALKNKDSEDKSGLLLENYDELSGIDLKMIDDAWKGAEAYHYLMLAQKQLYEGHHIDATITSIHLKSYEAFIPSEEIYCLIALASCNSKAFGTASKAFMKLESMESFNEVKREQYANLAMDIFTKHSPKDPKSIFMQCPSCSSPLPSWSGVCQGCETRYPVCIVTGRPLLNLTSAWTCKSCKHSAGYSDIGVRQFCPLCHASARI